MKKLLSVSLLFLTSFIIFAESSSDQPLEPEIPKGIVIRKEKGAKFQEWIFKYIELSKTSAKLQFQDEWYTEQNQNLNSRNSPALEKGFSWVEIKDRGIVEYKFTEFPFNKKNYSDYYLYPSLLLYSSNLAAIKKYEGASRNNFRLEFYKLNSYDSHTYYADTQNDFIAKWLKKNKFPKDYPTIVMREFFFEPSKFVILSLHGPNRFFDHLHDEWSAWLEFPPVQVSYSIYLVPFTDEFTKKDLEKQLPIDGVEVVIYEDYFSISNIPIKKDLKEYYPYTLLRNNGAPEKPYVIKRDWDTLLKKEIELIKRDLGE